MAEKNVECVMVELCQRLLALRIGIAASKDLFRRSSSHALPGVAMFTVVPVVDPLGCSQDRFAGWRQRRLFALPEQELPVLLEQQRERRGDRRVIVDDENGAGHESPSSRAQRRITRGPAEILRRLRGSG